MNILYFEGAGWPMNDEDNKMSDVGNYRIRTAFKNNDGVPYYIELMNGFIYDKSKKLERFSLVIDFCFEIPASIDDEIDYDKVFDRTKDHLKVREYNYTKEDITKWINENLNCSFDTIEILDEYHNYCVHDGKGGFNLINDFEVNHELAAKRKEAYEKIDQEYRKHCNSKYSVTHLLDMDNNTITVRCFSSDEKLGDWPRIRTLKIS